MTDLFSLILDFLASLFKSRAKLEAEILVLRQQINVLRRRAPKRPHLNNTDRFLFVWLCLLKTPEGRESLEIFVPPPYCRGHGHNSFRARFPALVPYSSELMSVKTFACSTKLTCESDGGRGGEHFSRATNIVRQTAELSAFTGAA